MSRTPYKARLATSAALIAIMMSACATSSPALTLPLASSWPATEQSPRLVANPPVVFAQDLSDLDPDPAARFGRLDNGLGYVIYKNGTPPGTASVWMRIGAGSVMEQENQRGLAHFLEHMAFQGSTHVAEGEMVRLLERDGLQFGADTNASTSFFETVYYLNLPVASDRIVDQALFLMRETAGNLTLDADAIERERGIILSEERARATVSSRAHQAELKALFPDAKYAERLPIGLTDVIRTAQRPAFAQFYNDFYRPEYATLIVVGDVDPDRIEAELRAQFADWRPGPQTPAALTGYGSAPAPREPRAADFIADGLADSISITWLSPPVDAVETRTKSFDDTLFAIATAILNQRYERQANSSGASYRSAGFRRQDIPRTARLNVLSIMPKDGQDRAAFDQAMAMLRDYLENGPAQEELDRLLAVVSHATAERTAGERTRQTQEIAGSILATLGSNKVFQSPAQSLAEFEAWKPRITLDVINAVLSQIDPKSPPVLWRQGDDGDSFDTASMLAAYREAIQAPLVATARRDTVAWGYTDFGEPTAITSREALADMDAQRVTFANGVVLTIKQTDAEDNTVHVSVQLGNGLLGLRPDQSTALFMARQVGLGGGLGRLRGEDIDQALAGRSYGLGFGIGIDSVSLSGRTTAADLDVQLQVLTAFIADPGLRSDALERVKVGLPTAFSQARTSPDGVYSLQARDDLYGDDPRFGTPELQDALAVENDAIAALLKDQLNHGPVEVVVVGDISPQEAIHQVAKTLGALPPFPIAVPAPGASQLRFPSTDLHRVYSHDGRPDQNLSVIAWPTNDFFTDTRQAAVLDLLAAVLTGRELEEVRERQAASYSVSAESNPSTAFPGFGFMISRASVLPEFDQIFYETIGALVDGLKQKPVDEDELTRARQPLIDAVRNERNSNGYWLGLLSGSVRNPGQISALEARERDLALVTAEDVQVAARAYLDMSKALRVQIKPRNETLR